jgi:predicted TPR repeat methyltransferase
MTGRQLRAEGDAEVRVENSPSDSYDAALRHFLANQLAPAEDLCRRALDIDSAHAPSLHLLGLVHAQTERLDSAVDLIAAAIRSNPGNPEYFSNLGGLLQRQHRFEEARKSFDLALRLAPNSAALWIKLGNLLRLQGRSGESLLTYDHALTLDSSNIEAANQSASLLLGSGRYEEALARFDLSQALSPDQVEVLCGRGDCLRRLGKPAEAAASYRRALELAPGRASVWCVLGEVCVQLGERESAIAAFRSSREIDPSDPGGATVWLMRLRAEELSEMPQAYVRALFDQYAPKFETALVDGLDYRGHSLLYEAVLSARRALAKPAIFKRAVDLGCGTGLVAAAFAKSVDHFIGVDLSPGMIEKARATGLYAELRKADMLEALRTSPDSSADLILSADALIYIADLRPVMKEAERVLTPGGVLAFTLERHEGDGVVMGEAMRYAHSTSYVHASVQAAGLTLSKLEERSARNEKGTPVPGLLVVAEKS